MFLWFHRLFNPHCDECDHMEECKSCETLSLLLEQERATNRKLLDNLLELVNPRREPLIQEQDKVPLKLPKNIPWTVRRELLESEDRAKAQALKEVEKQKSFMSPDNSVKELEKELDIFPEESNAS